MSEQLIQIVDENDVPLRGGTMEEAQVDGLWHRIARVMVQDNETGKYLLQKIKPNPYYSGGKWNTTSSGHVDLAETYLDTAVRETREEMSISLVNLKEIDRYKTENTKESAGRMRTYRRHNVTFACGVAASKLTMLPNSDEVEDTLWITGDELVDMRNNEPKSMTDGLIRFVDTRLILAGDNK